MLKLTWASDRCFNHSLVTWCLHTPMPSPGFPSKGHFSPALHWAKPGGWGCSSARRCYLACLNPGFNLQQCIRILVPRVKASTGDGRFRSSQASSATGQVGGQPRRQETQLTQARVLRTVSCVLSTDAQSKPELSPCRDSLLRRDAGAAG